jgi:exopolysaccharide biosynthesis predicted pyruvyltransferase EpsI
MNKKLKMKIRKMFGWFYSPILAYFRNKAKIKKTYNDINAIIKKLQLLDEETQRIFYLGITAHSNLGDMAQHYCICRWIQQNYPNANLIKIESDTVVFPNYNFLSILKKYYRDNDIIIFQSGYTTQDLGGNHELMHRLVIDTIPYARILMMPQTIFFKQEENRLRTSKCYNQAKNMLFLARDMVSYDQAKKMFPDIAVKPFPDIVTSLIGTLNFNNARNGICVCVRDDGEKFYNDTEIKKLCKDISKYASITITDTTINENYLEIRRNLQKYIENAIEKFSHYNVVITDRYHGTIFSLAAGTPVIIIKSNDHKVVTGADWFKGIYDDYVFVAKDLNEAKDLCIKLLNTQLSHKMKPYFSEHYYEKLKGIFSNL